MNTKQMNTIRPEQLGEPASEWRSLVAISDNPGRLNADSDWGNVEVVGDSMLGKGVGVNVGMGAQRT